jgi:pimeloyl-ACP methyl ester carboxylesterase
MQLKAGAVVIAVTLMCASCSAFEISASVNGGSRGSPHDPRIASLADLSTRTLRERTYGSKIFIEQQVKSKPHVSYLVSYDSDDLRVYSRVDVPASPAPAQGYPVIIFVHGWVGIDAAPTLDFYYGADSNYGEMIDAYVDAGFAVLTPGWRGHGTVNGIPAEGIEFMKAWDNASYLSPVFYAIDVLNLVDGLATFDKADLDLSSINLVAHSQGGDVALIALAVSGEGSTVVNRIAAASIWSGCFPSRFTQLETYQPMEKSPEAFLSGDGTWNGTAVGADGSINANFVFGYPSDSIVTPIVANWTSQRHTFSVPAVADTFRGALDEMYHAINDQVGDLDDARYRIDFNPGGKAVVSHDPRVVDGMSQIGGFNQEQYLTEPLVLQHSDRDFYSLSEWNADLCNRVNLTGGSCHDFVYAENTHSLRVSEHRWFSSENAVAGFSYAIRRDIALFRGQNPAAIAYRQ